MKKELTDITVVLDRSGSMASCRDDAEGGLNEFVRDQKEQPNKATFSLVQFDTDYECVHRAMPITDVPKLTLTPRGCTALLDAVGKAITETGERLKATAEDDRPGVVVFVIITDGQENASREYTKARVKEMIEHQQNAYQWQFVFLGANQDAFAEAKSMGISLDSAANYKPKNMLATYAVASRSLRTVRASAAAGRPTRMAFTDKDRRDMND